MGQEEIDEKLREWFKKLPLLSIKPVLYVLNVSEKEYTDKLKSQSSKVKIATQNSKLEDINNELVICAKIEEELADYMEEERVEYLKSMGIEKTGLERLIVKAYDLLGLISFLTAGPKEVRAWTIKKGTKAPQAAGVIHTDFERKFIKAEVIGFDEFMANGGWHMAKEKGKMRFEGKDYIMQDGDVAEFKIGI